MLQRQPETHVHVCRTLDKLLDKRDIQLPDLNASVEPDAVAGSSSRCVAVTRHLGIVAQCLRVSLVAIICMPAL